MMESSRVQTGQRRANRDFHAERLRERNFWRSILLFVFLLGGAATIFALMHLLNR